MDAKNLATIFAPCILRPDHDKTAAILQENEMQVTTLETMITHVEEMFKVSLPYFFLLISIPDPKRPSV